MNTSTKYFQRYPNWQAYSGVLGTVLTLKVGYCFIVLIYNHVSIIAALYAGDRLSFRIRASGPNRKCSRRRRIGP